MCSANSLDSELDELANGDGSSHFPPISLRILNNKSKCFRCENNAVLALRGKDVYCRSCFLAYCTHKFRSTIGKSHIVKPHDEILLGFSGGTASTALLHMIKDGLAGSSHKRFLFHLSLLFVADFSTENMKETIHSIVIKMTESGFPCYLASMDKAFRDIHERDFYVKVAKGKEREGVDHISSQNRLPELLSSIKNLTSKEDILIKLRNNLICDVAEAIGSHKVFLGDSTTRLATQVLAGIALGRGSQIPHFVGFLDKRHSVPVLRPLREFSSKEIAFYTRFHHLDYENCPSIGTMVNVKSSIMKLTEDFISTLQKNFPATESTIFRTGDKIMSSIENNSEVLGNCHLCSSILDTTVTDGCSAIKALWLSEKLSGIKTKEEKSASIDSNLQILNGLCFSCQSTVKDLEDINCLPPLILQKPESPVESSLKVKIEEFLLPEDS